MYTWRQDSYRPVIRQRGSQLAGDQEHNLISFVGDGRNNTVMNRSTRPKNGFYAREAVRSSWTGQGRNSGEGSSDAARMEEQTSQALKDGLERWVNKGTTSEG
ncbi:hypothetical protein NMY22_g12485 [Coprinellus aureogranulatus]|nr:hypothetical protein NMY22_g12485 [Coprinellus aureogranulatus]